MRFIARLLLVMVPVANAATGQILPVEAFASLPDVKQVKLSPGGTHVASLVTRNANDKRGTSVAIFNVETGDVSFPVYTDNEKFVINWLAWANDNRLLFGARFPAVRDGTPTTETRLLTIDVETGKFSNAIPNWFLRKQPWFPQFQDNVVDMMPDDPERILLSLALNSSVGSRVARLNIESGDIKTVEANKHEVRDWLTDRQHNIRIGIAFADTRYRIIHRATGEKKWRTLWEFDAFSEDQVWPLGFDHDPQLLYVRAYHDDKKAIFKVDLSSPDLKRELVFSDPDHDVNGSPIYSRKSQKVIGITYSTSGGFTFWDERYQALQNGLDKALPDTENSLYSFSENERRYVLLATSDTDAGAYYYGNRDSKEISHLADRYTSLPPEKMAEKKRISYPARDGLEIEAYLTLPKSAGDEPLPTVIFPHGGPISFDDGGFDYWTQFFANRGYAVVQMNFRGSGGYGYDFMKAGLQNWGLEMQNDVEDGTRWAIEQGIADPDRICMVGASYGGYAALMEAARNSGLYQCAVSFAGVTDVVYLVQSHRQYTNHELVKEQIGSDYKSLRKRSPVNLVEDIDVPVLLVHGTEDRSVRVRHSQKMHKALIKAGKNATYIEQEDGDHYLSNEKHRLELFHQMDDFLRRYLSPGVATAAQ